MRKAGNRLRFESLDAALLSVLIFLLLLVIIPFLNVLSISLSTNRAFLESGFMIFPRQFTLSNYMGMFRDGRIWIGYRTSLLYLLIGVPVNIFLTITLSYGLSRLKFPGGRFLFYAILVTLLFNGGIVPMYLLMMQLRLINNIWSVILASGVNTFYFLIMRTYMLSLPDSILESAKIDGAGEWRILFRIVIPLAMPIIATMILFYSVDRWNEWFYPMMFIRNTHLVPLQLIIRNYRGTEGVNMAVIITVMLPIMFIFPFLQKYFVKGIMLGAIKA